LWEQYSEEAFADADNEAVMGAPEDEEGRDDEVRKGVSPEEKGKKEKKKKKKGGTLDSTLDSMPAGAKGAGKCCEQYSTLWVRKVHSF
jgi:hypothetical protein